MNLFKYEKPKSNEQNFLEQATEEILSENYKEALICLKNCEELLGSNIKAENNNLHLVITHNVALCKYKLGKIPLAVESLETAQRLIKKIITGNQSTVDGLRHLKYLASVQLQLCALYSQNKNHEKALKYTQGALKSIKLLFTSLSVLVSQYSFAQKKSKSTTKLMDTISKLAVVLDKIINKKYTKKVNIYTGEGWISGFNIGNIMVIQPIILSDWDTPNVFKQEITYAKVLENICILISCYFSIAAELRFSSLNRSSTTDFASSREWHERALSICKCFLPASCPLYQHISNSYKKHYPKKIASGLKEPNTTPLTRINSKRQSEKPRGGSVKPQRKSVKPDKTATPMRKLTPSKKNRTAKVFGTASKPSTRDLHSSTHKPKSLIKDQTHSEALLKESHMVKTQKLIRAYSSESENCKFLVSF
jgi:tetratricopeptide (TPR) repeat protein